MEQHHATKIRFPDDDDDDVEALDVAAESSNLDESMCDVDGSVAACDKAIEPDVSFPEADDKTSADYYFDSYSHFGN